VNQIADVRPNEKISESEQRVMSVFKFDSDDLHFNREGKLSKKQHDRLRITARNSMVGFLFMGVFFTALFMLASDAPINELPVIPVAFIPGICIAIGCYLFWISSRAYRQGIVKSATGKRSFQVRGRFTVLCIGNECFMTGVNANSVLEESVEYRVYFTPADRSILSIERVR
jgi:hypothetical protein